MKLLYQYGDSITMFLDWVLLLSVKTMGLEMRISVGSFSLKHRFCGNIKSKSELTFS